MVRDDLLFRIQRRIGLIPIRGLGIVRRAIFFALLAWLPIVVWAGYTGRALPGVAGEPLLQHFAIHVRFLIAVPLFILGDGMAHRLTTHLVPYFLTSGLVREQQREAFREIVQRIVRLRNSTLTLGLYRDHHRSCSSRPTARNRNWSGPSSTRRRRSIWGSAAGGWSTWPVRSSSPCRWYTAVPAA